MSDLDRGLSHLDPVPYAGHSVQGHGHVGQSSARGSTAMGEDCPLAGHLSAAASAVWHRSLAALDGVADSCADLDSDSSPDALWPSETTQYGSPASPSGDLA